MLSKLNYMTNNETKLMIIENFIDWFTTDKFVRQSLKFSAKIYVDEDFVDEVQSRIDSVLKPVKEVLVCIAEDANMALAGDWDCSTTEGLEGFTAQLENIDSLKLIPVNYPA